jgi:hypothetical protein
LFCIQILDNEGPKRTFELSCEKLVAYNLHYVNLERMRLPPRQIKNLNLLKNRRLSEIAFADPLILSQIIAVTFRTDVPPSAVAQSI